MNSVSVIIPTYNCADRLIQALHSAASQTLAHRRMEVIVVDDGSTDQTGESVAAFACGSDINLRYVRQENAGPAAARNHGMRFARGEAIAFLDADDVWFPAKLARQLPLLEASVGLVYCNNIFVDASGLPIPDHPRHIGLHRGDAQLALFCDSFLLASAVCMQRACIERVGYFNEALQVGEDYEYFLRVVTHFHIDCVAERLLVRTVRPDSLSRRDYALDARNDLTTMKRYLDAHPGFAASNRDPIHRRLADYRYDFAYRLLDDGHRDEAAALLLKSLWGYPSFKAAKAFTRILLSPRRPKPHLGVSAQSDRSLRHFPVVAVRASPRDRVPHPGYCADGLRVL